MTKLYATITKSEDLDDGTLLVAGYASSTAVDSDGETITADAMKAALPDYMTFANIREMHQPKAAGVALKAEVQEDGRTYIEANIVDRDAIVKVKSGVYKGFSIGGRVTERDADNKKLIKGIRLSEISLVDRPANPAAVIEVWKGEGVDAPSEEDAANADGKKDDEKDAEPDGVKKSLWDVSRLASIILDLNWLQESVQWEANSEGDGSSLPAELKNSCKTLCGILVRMTQEETAELIGEPANVDEVALAEKVNDLKKAGARNNSTDASRIQKMHDTSVELGANCEPAEKLAKSDSEMKLEKLAHDLLEKVDSLNKRITELEAMPAPSKGALMAVGKGDDVATVENAATKEELIAKGDTLSLIKLAQQTPQRFI